MTEAEPSGLQDQAAVPMAASVASAQPTAQPAAPVPFAGPGAAGVAAVPGQRRRGHRAPVAVLALVDVLALTVAVAVSGRPSPAAVGYAAGVLAVLAASGMHRLRISLRLYEQAGRILTAIALPLPLALPWLHGDVAWHLALWSALLVLGLRSLTYAMLRAARRRGLLVEPALIVGTGEMGVLVARLLGEHPELGLAPLGFLDTCAPLTEELPLPLLGAAAELPEMIARFNVWRVIFCFPVDRDRDLVPALRACRGLKADIYLVPRLQDLGAAVPRAYLDEIWGIPLIPLRRRPKAGLVLKRVADLVAAAVLLCLFGPVLLVLAAVIRLRTGRSAIFRQWRVTGRERVVKVLKLRTLQDHGDPDTSWTVSTAAYTPLGRWLRSSHLDELPQLVNVLRGDMSLVGPRPERPYFAQQFTSEIPGYQDRSRMRAGITGWAQANGLHGDTSMRDRVRFDNQYIEYWSPWLDVVILIRTLVGAVVGTRGGRQ